MVTTRRQSNQKQEKKDGSEKSAIGNGKASLNGYASPKSNGNASPKSSTHDSPKSNGTPKSSSPTKTNGGPSAAAVTQELEHDQGGIWWRFMHYTLVPVLLMVATPTFNVLLWYTVEKCDGSYQELGDRLTRHGIVRGIVDVYSQVAYGSQLAGTVILAYMLWAVVLMKLVPGPRVTGPVTPKGNTPIYKDNGFYCYLLTLIGFAGLTYYLYENNLTPTIIFDHFQEFLGALTLYSHALCVFLYFKGLFFPSTTDCGSSGNPIFDYYWGTELYPRVFGVDIKVFTNCRFGMTVWPLLVLIFALKSYELHGFVDSMWVSCVLQMVYITKFFWWESGYMGTIDIMLDRAGYCICWGCLAFIPGMYTSVSYYLVRHPVQLGPYISLAILSLGLLAIAVNYLADKQKQDVRRSNAQCRIWGRKPDVIRAKYRLENGDTHQSLLLVSGFWGISRHFHYIPEISLALCWSVPALTENVLPYSYVIFLTVLLAHRSIRDEGKCSKKYQKYWKEYCDKVKYRMIPYVF